MANITNRVRKGYTCGMRESINPAENLYINGSYFSS